MISISRTRVCLAVGSALVLSAVAFPGAATATADSLASTGVLNLTSAQRATLDQQIGLVLAKTSGGQRRGVNEIEWKEQGAVMTFPIPGERKARAAGQPVGTRDFDDCDGGQVCLFDDDDGTGRKLAFYKCKFQKLRWYDFTNKTSSWVNFNRPSNTKASLKYWDGERVRNLISSLSPDIQRFANGSADLSNRADFLNVCGY